MPGQVGSMTLENLLNSCAKETIEQALIRLPFQRILLLEDLVNREKQWRESEVNPEIRQDAYREYDNGSDRQH